MVRLETKYIEIHEFSYKLYIPNSDILIDILITEGVEKGVI